MLSRWICSIGALKCRCDWHKGIITECVSAALRSATLWGNEWRISEVSQRGEMALMWQTVPTNSKKQSHKRCISAHLDSLECLIARISVGVSEFLAKETDEFKLNVSLGCSLCFVLVEHCDYALLRFMHKEDLVRVTETSGIGSK